MKFIPQWYDLNEVVKVDAPIEAQSKEEAERMAWMNYNGNPPAKCLYLQPYN